MLAADCVSATSRRAKRRTWINGDGSKYFELAEREMHICITYNFYLHNLFYGCYAEN